MDCVCLQPLLWNVNAHEDCASCGDLWAGGGRAMAASISLQHFRREADGPEAGRRAWKCQEQGITSNNISWYLEMWKHRAVQGGGGGNKALALHLLLRMKGQNVPEGPRGNLSRFLCYESQTPRFASCLSSSNPVNSCGMNVGVREWGPFQRMPWGTPNPFAWILNFYCCLFPLFPISYHQHHRLKTIL